MDIILSPEQAFILLYNALLAVVGGYLTSPVIVALVSLVKFLPFMKEVKAELLQIVFATIVTAVFWIAGRFGLEDTFNSTWTLLGTLLPALLAYLTGGVGATKVYQALRANGIPGLGSARTLPPGETVKK